ncbi:MAG: T9SS type A sorting domain-containing protein [Bacteroidetes bacterium]|nr:T9SS type A sorting domain-containing protein [Bacteroidota bacterium]
MKFGAKGFLLFSLLVAWAQGLMCSAQELSSSGIIVESQLPIIPIKTYRQNIQDEPKIIAYMGIVDNDSAATNIVRYNFSQHTYRIGIEIRGQSSQYFYPKKSFGLETRDSIGENLNISLLGLPKENDWILYGPYGDKTMLRNALIYELAGKMMDWAPRMGFCEVVLNNVYQGVYLFGENIKRDKNRVDIAKLVEKDTIGEDLTGGYIIKIDKGEQDASAGWFSDIRSNGGNNAKIFFQYHYPEAHKIQIEQQAYIQNFMHSFEESLNGSDFKHPDTGYASFIDVGSFIDFFILNEISRNVDGYRLSTFMYKDKDSNGGKLHMGPIWDFNLGFGNANYCEGQKVQGWGYRFNENCYGDVWQVPFWWERLLEDPAFRNKLKTRWMVLREGALHTDSIFQWLDIKTDELEGAIDRNFDSWPIFSQWVWPNSYVGNSYQDEIDFLKEWISERMTWLDDYMPGVQIYTRVQEQVMDLSARVYPNPFTDQVQIEIKSGAIDALNVIRVFNVHGQQIVNHVIKDRTTSISTSNYPAGLYFYELSDLAGRIHERGKLVKF